MPTILFVHIPKTAGTSFRLAAEQYFSRDKIVCDYGPESPDTSQLVIDSIYSPPAPDFARFQEECRRRAVAFVSGHFELQRYLPLFGASQAVAFLREPLQRMASEYAHVVTLNGYKGSFREFYSQPSMVNRQLALFCGVPVESVGFVGLTERYSESLEMINGRFAIGLEGSTLMPPGRQIAPAEETEIRALNQLDLEFYDHCKELFEIRRQIHLAGQPYAHAYLDEEFAEGVSGWAWWAQESGPVEVNILVNGECRRTVVTDVSRPELRPLLAPGRDQVGFRARISLARGDHVQCRVARTGQLFPPAPRVVVRGPASTSKATAGVRAQRLRHVLDRVLELRRKGIAPERRLTAVNDLTPLEGGWRATGNDPQFLLDRGLPTPGWYLLEVSLDYDGPVANLRIYFDTGAGFNEFETIFLPVPQSRAVAKRLVYLSKPLKAMRIDPMECECDFAFTRLRFVQVARGEASRLVLERLVAFHPTWREKSKPDIIAAFEAQAKDGGLDWPENGVAAYDSTFGRTNAKVTYADWLDRHPPPSASITEAAMSQFAATPLVSILVPVYQPQLDALGMCLESVLSQRYTNWELCIADDASPDERVRQLLADFQRRDARIKVAFRQRNGHICAASNSALDLVTGEFVALLDHDDCLAETALFHVVEAINKRPDVGLIYSDEDKIVGRSNRFDPHFKPDWNPDLLLGQNYISHLSVFRTSLVRQVGGFRTGFEGSQDHDLLLRVTELLDSDRIVHLPFVLYHWRAARGSTALGSAEKDYTTEAGLAAVRDHLNRSGRSATAEKGKYQNTYRVRWQLRQPAPSVSMLVPTRDGVEILRPCIDGILARTDYPSFDLLIIDNQSRRAETLAYFEEVTRRDSRVRVLRWDHPFNYSAINNFGARQVEGEILGLINSDVEPIGEHWLTEMVSQVSRQEIGCVGAKLYYPDNRIQHAGVVLGLGGVAGHSHKYYPREATGYFQRLNLVHNVSAVTGACLLVRRSVYDEVGGLNDHDLPVAFNDVDFCLRVREAGYRNLWTPHAELYHHESVSRGADDDPVKMARFHAEIAYMKKTWGWLLDKDPAYSPNLTRLSEDFSLG